MMSLHTHKLLIPPPHVLCTFFIIIINYTMALTLHSDIHSAVDGSSRQWIGGYTGVCSCSTPLNVHDHEELITDTNSLRTQPLHTGTRSGVRCITIQVQCVSFIEDGVPSDYWGPETYSPVDTRFHIITEG